MSTDFVKPVARVLTYVGQEDDVRLLAPAMQLEVADELAALPAELDDDPIAEGDFYEEVRAAVEQAHLRQVRVVPTFLDEEVTRPPFGLMRLHPAILHSRQVGGRYESLAAGLKRALEKDLRRR